MIKQKKQKERLEAIITILTLLICTLTIPSRAATDITYQLTHITCSEEQYMGNALTFILEADEGYKLPEKSAVTVTVGSVPVTNFSYNPISGGKKYAVMISGAQGKAVTVTAAAIKLSSDSTLSSLSYSYPKYSENNYSVPDFTPGTKEYNVTLPMSVADDAFIYVDEVKSDSNARCSGENYSEGGIRLVNGSGTCTYTVTAEDGSSSQYIIHFAKQQPLQTVYLNGGVSKSGNGESPETAVKTFAEAKELLASEGTIMICGRVIINDFQTWSLAEKSSAKLKRSPEYKDIMIEVKSGGGLTLSDITIDGGGSHSGSTPSQSPGSGILWVGETAEAVMDSGSLITGHSAYDTIPENYSYAAVTNNGKFIMRNGSRIENCYNENNSGAAAFYNRGQFTLDGGILKSNTAPYGGGAAILNSGKFIMQSGSIQNNSSPQGGGLFNLSGNSYIYGGSISNNKTTILYNSENEGGAGIYIQNGDVYLTGGDISANISAKYGGGVYQAGGTFTMKNGLHSVPLISDNQAQMGGGYHLYQGTAYMTGGNINENTSSSIGGGIFNQSGQLYLEDISITGNKAKTSGGGLILYGGTTNASGALTITGNTLSDSGVKNNLYVRTGNTLTVTGKLTGKIEVSSQTAPTISLPAAVCSSDGIYTITENDANTFSSDSSDFLASLIEGNIVLRYPKTPEILTSSLTQGTVNAFYSAALCVKSENTAFWSVTKGTLPGGLSLNRETGTISGTPVKKGTYSFTVKAENSGGFVSREFEIVIKPEPGNIKITKETPPGSPDVSLPQSRKELENILLSDNERKARDEGEDIIIKLDVQKVSVPLDPEAMSKIKGAAGDDKVAMYLDISLSKQIGDSEPELISKTGKPLRIVITIPKELRKTGRIFYAACVHNGETILLPDLDHNPNTITIETDRFSSYALLYKARKTETPTSQDESKDKNTEKTDLTEKVVLKKTADTKNVKVSSPSSPATGDAGIPLHLILLSAFSFVLVIFRNYYYNGKKASGGQNENRISGCKNNR